MHSVSSRSLRAAWQPVALASAVSACFLTVAVPVWAQTIPEEELKPVIVSASRFASDPASTPIGATVITAEQIRESGINNVNEAIRKIGGVYGRQDLTGGTNYSLDLRGFGTNSEQNLVVMVDGIRLSENEQQAAALSSIAIDSVERIEIVRGGSSVLYGAGATGGTIQIITKRAQSNTTRGSIQAGVGNRNYQELRASLAKGWDNFSIDASLSGVRTDNFRDNNKLKQENFSGGLQWATEAARLGLKIDVSRQDTRLPGGISWDKFRENPRQTDTPFNYASLDTERYTLFGEHALGNFQVAAELSQRDKTSKSKYESSPEGTAKGRSLQFSPRIKHTSSLGEGRNEVVAGFDFLDTERENIGSAKGTQKSKAFYVRDEIQFAKWQLALGARHERFEQDHRNLGMPVDYDRSFSLSAWDLQGGYDLTPVVNLFAKVGKSYRVANVDEYTFTPNGTPLVPQISKDLEVGAKLGDDKRHFIVRAFQHRLTNEIYYDPSIPNSNSWTGFGANANLDSTRRRGVELEAQARLSADFSARAVLQHVSAKFTDGPNSGKELALVPKNTLAMRLNWHPGNGHSADVGVQWASSQRYGNDFDNSCSYRIPSYTTLDARYAVRVGTWEFAVAGSNLTGKDYFTQAFGGCRASASIYPEAGRAIKFTARMDF